MSRGFEDGENILYVNGEFRGESEIGELMYGFKGNQLREPYSKYLDDGIFEIRGKVGTDITRVLYFFYHGRKIIMTNGFIKKTSGTPNREIKLAKSYRKDYLERVKNNE